jgi:hypothetical protein
VHSHVSGAEQLDHLPSWHVSSPAPHSDSQARVEPGCTAASKSSQSSATAAPSPSWSSTALTQVPWLHTVTSSHVTFAQGSSGTQTPAMHV